MKKMPVPGRLRTASAVWLITFSMLAGIGWQSASALDAVGPALILAPEAARPRSSSRGGWMTQGAEILPLKRYAIDVRFGFPSTDLGVHIPVTRTFEVTPFWTLDYMYYGVWNTGYFGDTAGVQLKGKVWGKGPHAISLGFDVGICASYWPGLNVGVQIGGPEFRYSHRWKRPAIAVITGFRMPIRVWCIGVMAEIPMLFNIGFEYNVLRNLNIHANLEFGPTVTAAPGLVAAGGHAGFQFGISYLW